jgi:hypothetical protein
LRRHYGAVLRVAAIKANAKMAESLFAQALSNGPGALGAKIFWLKCRAGWTEAKPPAEASAGYQSKKEAARGAAETAGVGTEWGDDLVPGGLVNWADSAPTGTASGLAGVGAEAAIPLRTRNRLHRCFETSGSGVCGSVACRAADLLGAEKPEQPRFPSCARG